MYVELNLLNMGAYRFVRSLVFFDLPIEKAEQRRAYAKFVKGLKKLGFYMFQKSIYVKMDIDLQSSDSTKQKVDGILPKEGFVTLLRITEKQFSSIEFLLGECTGDVITSDDRVVEL